MSDDVVAMVTGTLPAFIFVTSERLGAELRAPLRTTRVRFVPDH